MNINSNDLILVKLATLFHDPPWKPWGMRVPPYRLSGVSGTVGYWTAIGNAIIDGLSHIGGVLAKEGWRGLFKMLEERVGPISYELRRELLEASQGRNNNASVVGEALTAAGESMRSPSFSRVIGECSRRRKSHEVQGALLSYAVAFSLKGLKDRFPDARLDGVVELAFRAAESLCNGDDKVSEKVSSLVKTADTLSAALDRLALYYSEEAGGDHVVAREPIIVNPFNPDLKARIPDSIGVDKVGLFVALYVAMVTSGVAGYLSNNGVSGKKGSVELIFYHLAYSLLEPVWYLVVKTPPPADTRVPTHTIFDHISAAVAVANWVYPSGSPQGCLVLVDLASVQSWIRESRRLRDLWASSWIASWLAWAIIADTISKLGPDVMVQPPARLHPFYSSWLLSNSCGRDSGGWDAYCRLTSYLLGLTQYWPLDPTVPSMALLALPEHACNSIESMLEENYKRAWKRLLHGLIHGIGQASGGWPGLKKIYEAAERLSNGSPVDARVFPLEWRELEQLLLRLEPPLPIRLSKYPMGEAWITANEIAERIRESLKEHGLSGIDIARVILLQDALDKLNEARRGSSHLRASGRRSGQGYLNLADSIHKKKGVRNCHVCGYGLAIIDGEALWRLAGNRVQSSSGDAEIVSNAARQLQGERLCPYCLLKRVLRDLLIKDTGIVGLSMPENVREKIGRVSVDFYTSRAKLGYNHIKEAIREIISDPKLAELAYVAGKRLAPPTRFLSERDREMLAEEARSIIGDKVDPMDLVSTVEPLVLEAFHNAALARLVEDMGLRDLAEKLQSISQRREVSRIRRRYALVLSDGDMMGKRVLAGRLDISPLDYARKAINVSSGKVAERAASLYARIVEGYERARGNNDGSIRSLIVTPSYLFTVSRALAAEALIERHLVEALEGMLVYSGGDDLLAVAPPVLKTSSGGKGRTWYTALHIADLARRSYWGIRASKISEELVKERGHEWLIEIIGGEYEGFNRVPGSRIIVPALVAYGRSTVVYYVDSKKPLWLSMKIARGLLKSKKGSRLVGECNGLNSTLEKDVLIVANESTLAAPLPFQRDPCSRKLACILASLQSLLDALEEKKASVSLLYDAINYAAEYTELLNRREIRLASILMEKLVSRNTRKTGEEGSWEEVRRILEKAYRSLAPASLLYIEGYMRLEKPGWVKVPETPLSGLVTYGSSVPGDRPGKERILVPQLLALLEAAKATRQAV